MRYERFQCSWCGRVTAAAPGALCAICEALVPCEQCGGFRRAPPSIGVCERCRRGNGIEQRTLVTAANAVAALDLVQLPDRVTLYPRLTSAAELRQLARAAEPLAAEVRRLAGIEELRAPRRPPRRVTPTGVRLLRLAEVNARRRR